MADLMGRDVTAWIGGVALPVAMVTFDPAVFRGTVHGMGAPILGAFKPFGYAAIALGVVTILLHLTLKPATALFAGIFGAASVFSVVLGLRLLPWSLLGALYYGVGLLGLSPFVSGSVVAWRARRIYRAATGSTRVRDTAFGALLFLGVCAGAQWSASAALESSVADVCSGRPEIEEAGATRLARWSVLLDPDQLVPIYLRETDDARRRSLGAAYERVTGDSIERRVSELAD